MVMSHTDETLSCKDNYRANWTLPQPTYGQPLMKGYAICSPVRAPTAFPTLYYSWYEYPRLLYSSKWLYTNHSLRVYNEYKLSSWCSTGIPVDQGDYTKVSVYWTSILAQLRRLKCQKPTVGLSKMKRKYHKRSATTWNYLCTVWPATKEVKGEVSTPPFSSMIEGRNNALTAHHFWATARSKRGFGMLFCAPMLSLNRRIVRTASTGLRRYVASACQLLARRVTWINVMIRLWKRQRCSRKSLPVYGATKFVLQK